MFKVLSILATALIGVAAAILFLLGGFFSTAPLVIALQIAAALLMIWARLTLGLRSFHFSANPTEGGLITGGPYRYIRHPIYTAVLLLVWPGVIANWNIVNALLALLITLGSVIRMISEERLLSQHYPNYDDYARKTRRVIPFIL